MEGKGQGDIEAQGSTVEEKRTTWGVGLGCESIPEISLRDTHIELG